MNFTMLNKLSKKKSISEIFRFDLILLNKKLNMTQFPPRSENSKLLIVSVGWLNLCGKSLYRPLVWNFPTLEIMGNYGLLTCISWATQRVPPLVHGSKIFKIFFLAKKL